MKVALVYDRINKFGGAERILLALHDIWPEATLYTSVYNAKSASWAQVFPQIKTSFLQHLPFAKSHHEIYPYLMPIAFETFNLDKYDLVISVTSEAAKNIITKPSTCHICYCLTPTRYLWSGYFHYKKFQNYGLFTPLLKNLYPFIAHKLRIWDQIALYRPDYIIAISQTVASRIQKYYKIRPNVIYPPVDTQKFRLGKQDVRGKYYLIVSRLVSYKRIEIAIGAFNNLGWPLIIIGSGSVLSYLESIAHTNITFIRRHLTDRELLIYYQNCRALIFPGFEDFGLTIIEAQSVGVPVIAYRNGGAKETIIEGISGEFFDEPSSASLIKSLIIFDKKHYNRNAIRKNALRFDEKKFKKSMTSYIKTALETFYN